MVHKSNGAKDMDAKSATTNRYLTTNQAADISGMTPRNLESLRAKRLGPPYAKIGRLVRYHEGQLLEWLASRVVDTSLSR